MTEAEATAWIADHFGSNAHGRIAAFLDLVVAENGRQNLISPATIPAIWSRHAVDSAQLIRLVPHDWATWIDVGTGGGFPGVIVALLRPDRAVTLVEPRRKRAEFLLECCSELGLSQTVVVPRKIEHLHAIADVISARAVASIENLLRAARHCAKGGTTWLLPRGRSGVEDAACLSGLKRSMFHVEHSLTDPASRIVVLSGDGQ